MLIASLALIFDEATGLVPHHRVRELLRARNVVALLAQPVAWGELSVVEMAIAVSPDGFIIMADELGNTSFGQQIEGFAIALKRGTGALYADFDGSDAESGDPVEDPRLEQMHNGRSVLLGSFKESEVVMFSGVTKTAWKYFSTPDSDIAVHEGYMPEIMLSKSVLPAIMLSQTGPRFSMVFWFAGQGKKLHGYPGFGHGWSVAVEPVSAAIPGTAAGNATDFLQREWAEPDLEAIAELREFGVTKEQLVLLNQAFSGSGSIEAIKRVLPVFGRSPALADYLGQSPVPADAVDVQPHGFRAAFAATLAEEAREASGLKKFFNPFAWRPQTQLVWGLVELAVCAAIIMFTNWNDPWITRWLLLVIVAGGLLNSIGNLCIGAVRLRRAAPPGSST